MKTFPRCLYCGLTLFGIKFGKTLRFCAHMFWLTKGSKNSFIPLTYYELFIAFWRHGKKISQEIRRNITVLCFHANFYFLTALCRYFAQFSNFKILLVTMNRSQVITVA